MEASARLLATTAALHRHLRRSHSKPSLRIPVARLRNPNLSSPDSLPHVGVPSVSSLAVDTSSAYPRRSVLRSAAPIPSPPPNSSSLGSLGSLSLSHFFPSVAAQDRAFTSGPNPQEGLFAFDRDWVGVDGDNLGSFGEKGAIWTVVLLGWLGAEQRHLKKYAELYSSKGIRSVRFVVPMKEIMGFDLGKRVEEKIARFARELASWCSETERDGRDRRLLFHTFSNTGWLSYGVILENLQSRPDIIEKIQGCVVDSGAAPEISPQVWAAGFSAALLKKRSSLIYTFVDDFESDKVNSKPSAPELKDIRSPFPEILVLSLLEKFFRIVLTLPDVNGRLRKIISILSSKQAPCPQLYLYSSADKVIPVNSVENFIREQKALGRDVYAHDFGLSPHVDHLRSYPEIYSAKVEEFLKACCYSGV